MHTHTGSPRSTRELMEWQQNFYHTVRSKFKDKPGQLFEYDIETLQPTHLAKFLGIPEQLQRSADVLWADSKSNVNAHLHPTRKQKTHKRKRTKL